MIDIFNEDTGNMESFKSYDDLLEHIKALERQKFIETGKEQYWIFNVHSQESLAGSYQKATKAISILLTREEQDAYENGLNLIEMFKGDIDNTTQIVLTPDIDIKEIQKKWCREYCSKNGYVFLYTKQ